MLLCIITVFVFCRFFSRRFFNFPTLRKGDILVQMLVLVDDNLLTSQSIMECPIDIAYYRTLRAFFGCEAIGSGLSREYLAGDWLACKSWWKGRCYQRNIHADHFSTRPFSTAPTMSLFQNKLGRAHFPAGQRQSVDPTVLTRESAPE